MSNKQIPDAVIEAINSAQKILVCAHTNPDGDAVGSSIAMGFILKSLGKDCLIYNQSGLGTWLSFLERPCDVITDIDMLPFEPDLIIALDSGDTKRLGPAMEEYIKGKKSVNIDHHLGNPQYGSVANWVDPSMCATAELVANCAEALKVALYKPLAEALYVGFSTDTGNFTFGNTDISALEWLVKLAKTPINIAELRNKMDNNCSLQKLRFWGKIYQEIQIIEDGRFGYASIPHHYFEDFDVTKEDTEGLVEQIRKIAGVRVSMLIREDFVKKSESDALVQIVKVSMRSHGDDDVRSILTTLGGGGHKNAAGAEIGGSIESCLKKILPLIKNLW